MFQNSRGAVLLLLLCSPWGACPTEVPALSYEFTAYRMQHYNLQQEKHGGPKLRPLAADRAVALIWGPWEPYAPGRVACTLRLMDQSVNTFEFGQVSQGGAQDY